MLWTILKERMLQNPYRTFNEKDSSLTYEEVVIYAESLADKLTGSCYAVLCESDMFSSIALLACFAAGATAVPLSYKYGTAHLQRIIDYIHPPAIISDTVNKIEIIDTDTGKYTVPECSPALIMCTSGTTGQPKGVMLSEANILNNLCDISEYFILTNNDSILITRPLYHCAVLTGEFLISLYNGVNVYFDSEPFSPIRILNTIFQKEINILCGTPTTMTIISKCATEEKTQSLKALAISGECMSDTAAENILKAFHNCNIYHVYGLTEASPRVTFLPPRLFATNSLSIGQPLRSVSVDIVDENGHSLPKGSVGELIIKSPSNMLGYYNQPNLTAEVLKDGWLHTRDFVRMDEMNLLEIKGRKDDMIIRSGMNIYPVEIENELKKDKRISEVLAYGYKDSHNSTQIGVKIVGDFTAKDEFLKLCRHVLPSYEVPTKVDFVDELPKNGSGKTIRR